MTDAAAAAGGDFNAGLSKALASSIKFDGTVESWAIFKLRFCSLMKRANVYEIMVGTTTRPTTALARDAYDKKNQLQVFRHVKPGLYGVRHIRQ
jgi:hypothetical protein